MKNLKYTQNKLTEIKWAQGKILKIKKNLIFYHTGL